MIYLQALVIVISVFLTQNADIKGVRMQFVEDSKPAYKLYIPEDNNSVKRCLMLVNGLLDSDDKLLDIYSKYLAKNGCAVFVPQIDGLNRLILGQDETKAVKDSYKDMVKLFPDIPKSVFTFCFSNGPVFFALKEFAADIDSMYLFDSYADMKSMIAYNICGHYQIPGKNELFYVQAVREIAEVYYENFAQILPSERRGAFLSALKTNESAGLNTEEKKAYAFLKNKKYMKYEELFDGLPENFKKRVGELSPINYVDQYNCRMTFIHCKDDAMVPYYESVKLYEKSPSTNKKLILMDLPLHTADSQNMNEAGIFYKLKYLYEFYIMTVELLK